MDRLQELVRLHRLGTGSREVARLLAMSPNTERASRNAFDAEQLLKGPVDALPALETLRAAATKHLGERKLPAQQRSRIEDWEPSIDRLMKEGLQARAIFDRLRLDEAEFKGTYPQVKRMCRALKRSRGVDPKDVAIPVETEAGDVAQVDFGYVGKLFDPQSMTLRDAWCFVMVLGFSRKLVTRVVFDQRTDTWIQLHVEAFNELGGAPSTMVPDNLKAAVVRAAFAVSGPSSELNRSYREMARHYGMKIDPTPPYAPKKKGKVESAVKYVKRNFFRGRHGEDITIVRAALARWTAEVANQRVHGTTHQIPEERFATFEQPALLALPPRPFEPVVWKRATVHTDSHVSFERRLYSVPWTLVSQEVWIRATAHTVTIYTDEEARVATHDRRAGGPRSTCEEHLPGYRSDLRHRSREWWEERAGRMGDEVRQYISEVFDSDDVLSQLRTVQAIVTHLEGFPVERARAACRRASFYACYQYGSLKNMLRQALDFEPLPHIPIANGTGNASPRHARNIAELIAARTEVPRESN